MPETDDALLIALAQRGSLDAVAELFERYWPVAWQAAFAVTGNATRAIDELRRDRRLTEVSEDVPPLATIGADRAETGAGIVAAVAALPTEKRLVVVLRFWLDYTLEEIADSLEIPFGTVASRLSRALDDLRAQLEAADV